MNTDMDDMDDMETDLDTDWRPFLVFSRYQAVLLALLLFVVMFGFATYAYNNGYEDGEHDVRVRVAAEYTLPACQEDEYLYPLEDYKGPGKNKPNEYHCVPFDDLLSNVIIRTLASVNLVEISDGEGTTIIPPINIDPEQLEGE